MREAPLPAAEAKKRYLVYLALRLTGLAVMAAGVWLVREVGQAPGLAVVLLDPSWGAATGWLA